MSKIVKTNMISDILTKDNPSVDDVQKLSNLIKYGLGEKAYDELINNLRIVHPIFSKMKYSNVCGLLDIMYESAVDILLYRKIAFLLRYTCITPSDQKLVNNIFSENSDWLGISNDVPMTQFKLEKYTEEDGIIEKTITANSYNDIANELDKLILDLLLENASIKNNVDNNDMQTSILVQSANIAINTKRGGANYFFILDKETNKYIFTKDLTQTRILLNYEKEIKNTNQIIGVYNGTTAYDGCIQINGKQIIENDDNSISFTFTYIAKDVNKYTFVLNKLK